jgi:hypothetical protein
MVAAPGIGGQESRPRAYARIALGLEAPNFRVRQHVTGLFYAPLILFADLDGDGQEEMVVISHEQVWGFDPATGQRTFYAAYGPQIRTYTATVAAVKLRPQDRCPALVMINPFLPGLKAVRQDGRSGASELWKVVIGGKEDQYQKRVTLAPAGPALVYDLESDGRHTILASIRNERGDGQERLAPPFGADVAAQVDDQADTAQRGDGPRPAQVLLLAAAPAVQEEHARRRGRRRARRQQRAVEELLLDGDLHPLSAVGHTAPPGCT